MKLIQRNRIQCVECGNSVFYEACGLAYGSLVFEPCAVCREHTFHKYFPLVFEVFDTEGYHAVEPEQMELFADV